MTFREFVHRHRPKGLLAAVALAAVSGEPVRDVNDDAVEPMIELRESDYISLLPKQYATIDTTDLEVTIDRGAREITLTLVSTQPHR